MKPLAKGSRVYCDEHTIVEPREVVPLETVASPPIGSGPALAPRPSSSSSTLPPAAGGAKRSPPARAGSPDLDAATMPPGSCEFCKEKIPTKSGAGATLFKSSRERRRDARFCSTKCRQASFRVKRARLRPSLEKCPHCKGTGHVTKKTSKQGEAA